MARPPIGPSRPSRRRTAGSTAVALVGLLVGLAGCGSASRSELPAAAGPDRSPPLGTTPVGSMSRPARPAIDRPMTSASLRFATLSVALDAHARTLTLTGGEPPRPRATIDVGVGPTQVACTADGPCFVVDTQGDALLVVRVARNGDDLRLVRRVYVAGAPYAITLDPRRKRIWLTLTARNELVELAAHGRPHILQRLPTIRQPNLVSVDPASGDVTVRSPDGTTQHIPDPASPDR